ncbi:MAG: YitT family protein [Clostridia bacterium]|nr:YitT family protein [Clostridia bacterium]
MKKLKTYLFITFGTLILAIGLNMFLVPFKISTGGVSAIGTVLKHLLSIPLSVTNITLNALLFIFGSRYLQKSALIKTVWGIIILSLFLEITAHLPVYKTDMLASSVFGGVLTGTGIGIVLRQDASTGGSDFLALILKSFLPHLSAPKLIFATDIIIVSLAAAVFKSFTVAIYSLIALYISLKMSDAILIMGEGARSVKIISKEYRQIADDVIAQFDRGITGISARGIYTDTKMEMLLCVVMPKELNRLVQLVKNRDKGAFIIITDVHEVLGEGFKM